MSTPQPRLFLFLRQEIPGAESGIQSHCPTITPHLSYYCSHGRNPYKSIYKTYQGKSCIKEPLALNIHLTFPTQ